MLQRHVAFGKCLFANARPPKALKRRKMRPNHLRRQHTLRAVSRLKTLIEIHRLYDTLILFGFAKGPGQPKQFSNFVKLTALDFNVSGFEKLTNRKDFIDGQSQGLKFVAFLGVAVFCWWFHHEASLRPVWPRVKK